MNKDYKIIANDSRLNESLKQNHNRIINILDFFNINYISAEIKVLGYEEFKKEYVNYIENDLDKDVTGFIEDDKDVIIVLKYEDFKYTSHVNDTYDDYVKIVIHELVHLVHSVACNHNYPSYDLQEGIAVYLSDQYDFVNRIGSGLYYEYGLKIYEYLKTNSKESLLKLLNVVGVSI